MSKFLLIINGEILNPSSKEGTNNYFGKIFYYLDTSKPTLIPIDFRLVKTITDYNQQTIKHITKKRHDEAKKKLVEILGRKVANDLIKGNCEIVALINSPGGWGGYSYDLQRSILYLGKLGALTRAYIFCHAASAAFIIASAFKEKYCLLQTEFMFHRGRIDEDAFEKEELSEEEEKELESFNDSGTMLDFDKQQMEEVLNVFFSTCDKDKQEEARQAGQVCLDNIDADVYYSGEHLLELGIVTDCPLSPKELVNRYKAELQIDLRPESSISQLLSNLEKECEDLINHGIFKMSIGLYSDTQSPHIKKHG